ncbi:Serine protease inhibitor 77Ba [Eumeta japonica]|uniref:Serine protease inhibitor 77Ba n=1 Tax=Eumeta variegata TaxID=151549 RepID=A0A4C1V0P1_EUMVA|nr:Serine protease inhibitor 77Ba [Eumeta japonica]
MRLLDRMSLATDQHFVFAPLSTWMQLTTLLEGARGTTLQEMKKVTHMFRSKCNRRNQRKIMNELKQDIYPQMNMSSAIVLDSAYDIKHNYLDEVKYGGVRIFVVDFDEPQKAAARINEYLFDSSSMEEMMFPQDFQHTTVLTADAGYFMSEWKTPFQTIQTEVSPFYDEKNFEIGKVNLMRQTGVFSMTTIPTIKATVLELKCSDRISMLLFLPVEGASIYQVYESLMNIRLQSIIMRLERDRRKDVDVYLPRFEIVTDVDNLPELLYDMGVKKMFYPRTADFHGMSDYKLFVSMVQQKSRIEVTEGGVVANFVPQMLISGQNYKTFKANRPFAFMVVDRTTELILFAGMYSQPSLY